MNFQQVKQDAFRRLGYDAAPATAIDTRIGAYVNRWHRKVLSAPAFRSFRKVQLTQASVANTFDYGVALAEIHRITERTNDRRLIKKTEDWWKTHYPDPTADTGTPIWWVPLGITRTQRRPANASELFVISTAAGDTGTAYVEVIRSDGYPRSLSVTMTGVTGVSLSAAMTDVVDVVDFFVSAAAVGTITLREDSGTGVVLSTIPIGALFPRFLRYALVPTPAAVVTYFLDGLADIVDMAQNTDRPLLYEDFHDILADGAVLDDWIAFGGKNRAQDVRDLRGEMQHRMQEMRNWVWMQSVQPESDETIRRAAEDEFTLPLV